MQLILASNNSKKLRELQALLGPLGLNLVNQGALGIPEAEEPHITFVENALAKARHAAQLGQGPAIADDSGLCVRALGGLPGVRSARYALDAGRHIEGVPREVADAANNALLLETLQGQLDRHAHFTCLLVAVRHAQDPEPLIAEGHWAGVILDAPQGHEGFGYDPLLWLPDHGCSAAAMSSEQKNAISHRALACRRMRELMATHWGLHGASLGGLQP
jgi:XTP/dITP diphosphohydrolase